MSGDGEMKKLIVMIMVVLLLAACNQETTAPENKAKNTYDIMVKAMGENRQLTEKEESKVNEFTHQIRGDKTTDLDRAISAMQMNFYQPIMFEKAKESANKYMN
jgi:hypothetical protein